MKSGAQCTVEDDVGHTQDVVAAHGLWDIHRDCGRKMLCLHADLICVLLTPRVIDDTTDVFRCL